MTERIWTFEWMRFARTGLSASYTKLAGAEHELLWYDFARKARILEGHPFRGFFLDIESDDLEAEVKRLEALGAKRVAFVKRWWVLEAPTGQRFCVVNPQRGTAMDGANVHALMIAAAEASSRATFWSIRVVNRVMAGWGKPAEILSTHSAAPLPVLHGILFLLVERREFGVEEISVTGNPRGRRF